MYKNLLLFALLLGVLDLQAQCPQVVQQQPNTPLVCDLTNNQIDLWNASYWWSPLYETTDLPEGMADLRLTVTDSCGADTVQIGFALLLDLDQNDTLETAIYSDSLPPADTIYFGNLLTAGGTPRSYDQRMLPAANKYRFAAQQTINSDSVTVRVRWTSAATPNLFFSPALPHGIHKIVWYVRFGNTVDTLERIFQIRDCANPNLSCVSNLNVNMPQTGTVDIYASDLLTAASDNVTPTAQLVYGIRKAGTGLGFPSDTVISYICGEIGLPNLAELWVRDRSGNTQSCTTNIVLTDTNDYCITPPPVKVCVVHSITGDGMEEYDATATITASNQPTVYLYETSENGACPAFDLNPYNGQCTLEPIMDANPLNGVSTFDLVLIQKHILSIESLNSPYNLIAADANKNGAVTTFDIVELRRLILGIYQSLPNNKSWRFIPEDYIFLNPLNPFQSPFPESVTGFTSLLTDVNFLGIKVGDVNNTATPTQISKVEERLPIVVSALDINLAEGQISDVALFLSGNEHYVGGQMALQIHHNDLEIIAITAENIPDFGTDNWHQMANGQLRISWNNADADHALIPVLHLRVRAKSNVRLSAALQPVMNWPTEIYTEQGETYPLQVQFLSENTTNQHFVRAPQPNPTQSGVQIPIVLKNSESVQVNITDALGKIVFFSEQQYIKGAHQIEIPPAALRAAGVYYWRVSAGEVLQTGKIQRL